MKKCIFVIVSILSTQSFADCTVAARVNALYKVVCTNYLGQSTLFDSDSNEYIVIKSKNQVLAVDGGEAEFDIGMRLFLNPQQAIAETKPIAIEVELEDTKPVFDPTKANHYRLFAKGLSYEYEKTSADFAFSNTTLETSNNEFKSLPLAFNLEMMFDSYGIILGPDFETKAGEVVVYKSYNDLSFGLHAKVSLESKNTEVTSSGSRLQDDDESSSSIQTGLYIRLEHEMGNKWFFYGEGRSGYAREVTKTYNNLNNTYQELAIDAGFVQIEPTMYYQVSNNFKLGFGASLYLAVGMIQIEDQTGVVSDGVTLTNLGLYPLKLQMAF